MRSTTLALLLGGITLMATSTGAANLSPGTQALLESSSYIYVATERKNGELGSFSPIWFMYDQGKIFFTTSPGSWKAKRIAKGRPLTIHVGTENGPVLVGKAQKITDAAYIDKMGAAYGDKYWMAWMGLFRPRSDRVSSGKTMAYVVEVEEK
jgi:hypothetical protein